jgi:hypothetical protein
MDGAAAGCSKELEVEMMRNYFFVEENLGGSPGRAAMRGVPPELYSSLVPLQSCVVFH